jgi:glycosyltransferase involved in cell wall biosynthesis
VLAVADPDSEVANVLRDSCGGWVVVPEDARAFRDAFEKIRAMSREERLAAGRRGRRYALDVFGRERCLARLLAIVRGAA